MLPHMLRYYVEGDILSFRFLSFSKLCLMFSNFNSEKNTRSSIFDIESGKLDCNFAIKDLIICIYAYFRIKQRLQSKGERNEERAEQQ